MNHLLNALSPQATWSPSRGCWGDMRNASIYAGNLGQGASLASLGRRWREWFDGGLWSRGTRGWSGGRCIRIGD